LLLIELYLFCGSAQVQTFEHSTALFAAAVDRKLQRNCTFGDFKNKLAFHALGITESNRQTFLAKLFFGPPKDNSFALIKE
jgi:hypothetical protein